MRCNGLEEYQRILSEVVAGHMTGPLNVNSTRTSASQLLSDERWPWFVALPGGLSGSLLANRFGSVRCWLLDYCTRLPNDLFRLANFCAVGNRQTTVTR